MSYLNINTYDKNLDSFIESCFNIALEQENEKLLEYSLLNELSDDIKLNAAEKTYYELGLNGPSNYPELNYQFIGLNNIRRGIKNAEDDYIEKKSLNAQLQYKLNKAKTAHGRKRLLSYYTNIPTGTEFASSYKSLHGERIPTKGKTSDDVKDIFNYALNNEAKIKKEFEDIQNEINKTKQEIEDNASPWQRLSIKVRQKIRKFINYLTKKYHDFRKKYRNTPPEKRGIIDRLLFGITEIIEYLTDIIYMR